MADPQQVLAQRVRDAIVASSGPDYRDADPLIRPSAFADFQSNAALPLGKRLGRAPREVAAELAARLDVADLSAEPAVSGPGFINFTLRDDWIAAQATPPPRDAKLRLGSADPVSLFPPCATTGSPPRPPAGSAMPSSDWRRRPSRRPSWWSTRPPISPRRCTSGTCARRSPATPSPGSWSSPGTG